MKIWKAVMGGRKSNPNRDLRLEKTEALRLYRKRISEKKKKVRWTYILSKLEDIGWSDKTLKGYHRYLRHMGFRKTSDLISGKIEKSSLGIEDIGYYPVHNNKILPFVTWEQHNKNPKNLHKNIMP